MRNCDLHIFALTLLLIELVTCDILPNPDIIGPQGAKGQRGARGNRGPPGTAGTPGVQGSPGAEGQRGTIGPQGVQGPPGIAGTIKGPTGDKGPKGLKGPRGQKGPDGPVGYAGNNGEMGPPGEDGDPGTAITIGDPGEKGETGADGDPGLPGEQGPIGDKGPKGAAGAIIPDGFYDCETLTCNNGIAKSYADVGTPFCKCECEKGLYLVNETECFDVCRNGNGGCQHTCQTDTNSNEGFRCSCNNQFSLVEDSHGRCAAAQCQCAQGTCIQNNCVDNSKWKFQLNDTTPTSGEDGFNLKKGVVFLAILIWLIILTIIFIIAVCFACVGAWKARKRRKQDQKKEKEMTQFFFPAPYAIPALQVDDSGERFSDSPVPNHESKIQVNNNHNEAYRNEGYADTEIIDPIEPEPLPNAVPPAAPVRPKKAKRRSKAPPPPPAESPEPAPTPPQQDYDDLATVAAYPTSTPIHQEDAYMNLAYEDDQPTYANQLDELPPALPPKDYQDPTVPALPPKDYR